MDSYPHDSLDNFALHQLALIGDDEGVQNALRQGASVNALDSAGRTAIMCAIAGENWQNIDAFDASLLTPKRLNVIRTLLNHPDISLLTLNCPQASMNGVVPLGMAAWLNVPQIIKLLLEASGDTVSVDGMDSHGATALMYAARDGSLEVVQLLLSHGARPDFRDRNHRTSIQFALGHPRVLWLLETVLRRHRWRETASADRSRLAVDSQRLAELSYSSMPFSDDFEPPPADIFTKEATSKFTTTLVSSIRRSDLPFIHSLLFSPALPTSSPPALYPMSVPALVNLPDAQGWSLIHHCVDAVEPSIAILDALYCVGAEVSLFTTHEQSSPLHILARRAHVPGTNPDSLHSLHDFTLHLIQDLRAPLAARDKDDETCIHIAAEHGHSIDLLLLFLDCDVNSTVRNLKNSRGLTAVQVCKPEFLSAFGSADRPGTSLSTYTIRQTSSFASLASLSELNDFFPPTENDTASICPNVKEIDVHLCIQELLTSLRLTSPSHVHHKTAAQIQTIEATLADTQKHCDRIVAYFQGRIEDVSKVVYDLRNTAERIQEIRGSVALSSRAKMTNRGIVPVLSKRRTRDSEDSQLTAVSATSSFASFAHIVRGRDYDEDVTHTSVGVQTSLLDLFISPSYRPPPTSSCHEAGPIPLVTFVCQESFQESPQTLVCKELLQGLWDVEKEINEIQAHSHLVQEFAPDGGKAMARYKQLVRKKKKIEERIYELDLESRLAIARREKESVRGDSSLSGSVKGTVKAWFKKMVVPSSPVATGPRERPRTEIVMDLDVIDCPVGHSIKSPLGALTSCGDAIDASIDGALKTSEVVLEATERDLMSIHQALDCAQSFIDMASHSLSRTERVVRRALKKRETLVADLHAALTAGTHGPGQSSSNHLSPASLGYDLAKQSSISSISSFGSDRGSIISDAATLMENDDDETRIIRRLLLRKIEAQWSGAWDEVDKVTGWLSIVKEAVRGVKRRALL